LIIRETIGSHLDRRVIILYPSGEGVESIVVIYGFFTRRGVLLKPLPDGYGKFYFRVGELIFKGDPEHRRESAEIEEEEIGIEEM